MFKTTPLFLLGIFFSVALTAQNESNCACNKNDYRALRSLYLHTDGDQWVNNTGWEISTSNPPEDCDFSNWHGVTCVDGRVTAILLPSNNLSGFIPKSIGDLNELRSLNLLDNQLIGNIPSALSKLFNLESLWLRENQLTGVIPSELGRLANLELLDLERNDLSGSIPSDLGQLQNLNFLSLFGNQLTRSIPTELGQLENLERLIIYDNQFSGPIPASLGNLTNLVSLDLDNNNLTGEIPSTFSQLENLTLLYLNNNQLTGSLPTFLGDFPLNQLWLHNNQFTGCVPSSFKNLCDIEEGNILIRGNPDLEAPDFASFCTFNTGICPEGSLLENSAFIELAPLFDRADTIWSPGAAGTIAIRGDNVVPIIVGNDCNVGTDRVFAVASVHGAGRVMGFAHEGVVTDGATAVFDNLEFFDASIDWLNQNNSKRIALNPGFVNFDNTATLRNVLSQRGYTFSFLNPPFTKEQLEGVDVVIMGNDWRNVGTISDQEVSVVQNFVDAGGGALLLGLGWSWPGELDAYPINRMAQPFGFQWTETVLFESTTFNDFPYFTNLYPVNPTPCSSADESFAFRVQDQDESRNVMIEQSVLVKSVNVYPNPTNGLFFVEVPVLESPHELVVINVHGQVIRTKTIEGEQSVTMNLQDQAKGIYMVQLSGKEHNSVKRMVLK